MSKHRHKLWWFGITPLILLGLGLFALIFAQPSIPIGIGILLLAARRLRSRRSMVPVFVATALVLLMFQTPWYAKSATSWRLKIANLGIHDGCGVSCAGCGAKKVVQQLSGYLVTLEFRCGLTPYDSQRFNQWRSFFVSRFIGTVHETGASGDGPFERSLDEIDDGARATASHPLNLRQGARDDSDRTKTSSSADDPGLEAAEVAATHPTTEPEMLDITARAAEAEAALTKPQRTTFTFLSHVLSQWNPITFLPDGLDAFVKAYALPRQTSYRVENLRFVRLPVAVGTRAFVWTAAGEARVTVTKLTIWVDQSGLGSVNLHFEPHGRVAPGYVVISSEPLGRQTWTVKTSGKSEEEEADPQACRLRTKMGDFTVEKFPLPDSPHECRYRLLKDDDAAAEALWEGKSWCKAFGPFVDYDGDGFPEFIFPASYGAARLIRIYPNQRTLLEQSSGI